LQVIHGSFQSGEEENRGYGTILELLISYLTYARAKTGLSAGAQVR
jgi:hypothetical protein